MKEEEQIEKYYELGEVEIIPPTTRGEGTQYVRTGERLRNFSQAYTYFILDERSNAVKIGKTEQHVKRRKNLIQVDNPNKLKIIGGIYRDIEAALHRKFREFHIRGEWFRYEGKLKSYIEESKYREDFRE